MTSLSESAAAVWNVVASESEAGRVRVKVESIEQTTGLDFEAVMNALENLADADLIARPSTKGIYSTSATLSISAAAALKLKLIWPHGRGPKWVSEDAPDRPDRVRPPVYRADQTDRIHHVGKVVSLELDPLDALIMAETSRTDPEFTASRYRFPTVILMGCRAWVRTEIEREKAMRLCGCCSEARDKPGFYCLRHNRPVNGRLTKVLKVERDAEEAKETVETKQEEAA